VEVVTDNNESSAKLESVNTEMQALLTGFHIL
jgi:hypothetical protein